MSRNRRTIGIVLITVGFLGLMVSLTSLTMWFGSIGPARGRGIMPMPMMQGWNCSELKEVSGAVEKIEWMEIELEVDGGEVEVHGPPWFWQRIGVKEGDAVTAKGVFVSMMEPEEGWHEGLIPFEITVDGKTYGNAGEGIPVWMQD